ncbi:MAG: UDP-N-acetylmuramoyl-L-alanyl-D-glutamate--2,6-diaminopimelate ligase [Fimbriimonadaceae bacterium]|nr:UDP-N-acetylmuramoyl-L-alanyl-D-glutamate--2,6-diaminopimelate ligase [Fimbriimonadaceae bacterium]
MSLPARASVASKNLRDLILGLDEVTAENGDVIISGIQADSRRVMPGDLFVAMPGLRRDAREFIPDALERGAVAVMAWDDSELRWPGLRCPTAAYADVLWQLCDRFFAHPTRGMNVIGITGTNGKTTTAWLVRRVLEGIHEPTAYLGTLGLGAPGIPIEHWDDLPNTTPLTVDLYNDLARLRDSGATALAMEVSSHALAEKRADGVEFDVVAFTNFSQDHLDYHGSMEAYFAAKTRLFLGLGRPPGTRKTPVAVFNVGDETIAEFARQYKGPAVTYAVDQRADLILTPIEVRTSWMQVRAEWHGQIVLPPTRIALGGQYNVENFAATLACIGALGRPWREVVNALPQIQPVPGRFQPVPNARGVDVIVDYAHTPDALEKLIAAARQLTKGRIITVFGCGGDRDRTKRPQMGDIARRASDIVVVTSDNPRTEDPDAIIAEILHGESASDTLQVVPDRATAIRAAIRLAAAGDTILIAGKGHETYQIVGGQTFPFSDWNTAQEALNETFSS